MTFNLKKIGLREVGIGMIVIGLALLLPTPVVLVIAGGWLGWKGWKQKTKSESPETSADTDAPQLESSASSSQEVENN